MREKKFAEKELSPIRGGGKRPGPKREKLRGKMGSRKSCRFVEEGRRKVTKGEKRLFATFSPWGRRGSEEVNA